MGGLQKSAAKFDTIWGWFQRFRSVAEALGVYGWIRGLVVLGLIALWGILTRLFDHLPFWADAAIGIGLAIACMHFYVVLRKAWSLRGLKKIDIEQLGKDCLSFKNDVFAFLVDRQDNSPKPDGLQDGGDTRAAMDRLWARERVFRDQTRIRLAQRFMGRAFAMNVQLEAAGIGTPDLWGFEGFAAAIAIYYGTVGELLERGLLAEARQLDPETARRLHVFV